MLLCKSEICDNGISFAHENVGELKVAMEESFFAHFDESTDNILEDFDRFCLGHSAFFLDKFAQIALITEFGDNVTMRNLSDDIEAFEDVSMVQSCKSFYFTI